MRGELVPFSGEERLDNSRSPTGMTTKKATMGEMSDVVVRRPTHGAVHRSAGEPVLRRRDLTVVL
jgi:hypothetical protein